MEIGDGFVVITAVVVVYYALLLLTDAKLQAVDLKNSGVLKINAKKRDFCKTKTWVFILPNHCRGVNDLKVKLSTNDLVTKKRDIIH